MSTVMKHRKYGGSTAARTINCPGWVVESQDIPKGEASDFALEGTALHDVMEAIILDGTQREDIMGNFEGTVIGGVTITGAHINNRILPAFDAWDGVRDYYNITDWEPEVECSFADHIGGYSDLVATNEICDVFIIDWKFGQGVMVDPTNSHQGRFYAMAARKGSVISDWFKHVKRVYVVIIQPNDRGAPVSKVWETTIDAINEYQAMFMAAIDQPTLSPGDHCKWCPAAPVCPVKSGKVRRALHMTPRDTEILGEAMDMVGPLKEWIKQVETAVYDQINNGNPVEGWKLVPKRSYNHWKDEEVAIKALRRRMHGVKNIMKTELLSPAQMLLMAKELDVEIDIEPLTHKSSSGSTLAHVTDKRQEVPNPKTLGASLAAIS